MSHVDTVLSLIRTRRSVREFTSDPLPEGCEQRLLEAFRWAPSGGNAQPWHVRAVRADELKQRLCQASLSQPMVVQAPVVYVVCADLNRAFKAYKQRGVELYCLQDTAAAIQNLLLAAHAMGLGACWIGAFRERSVTEILRLPEHLRPIALVAVGVAAQEPRVPPRRSVEEIFSES
jgi:nitroreductase